MDKQDVAESVRAYEAVIAYYTELKDDAKFNARTSELTKRIETIQGELADLIDKRTNADKRIEEARRSIVSVRSRLEGEVNAKLRANLLKHKGGQLTKLLDQVARLKRELGLE